MIQHDPAMQLAQLLAPCPVCEGSQAEGITALPRSAVETNRLWPSAAEARSAPSAAIDLVSCTGCGHIFNATFNPEMVAYNQDYESSQMFSPRFRAYAESLAMQLLGELRVPSKGSIVEVGGGRGEFLQLICDRAGARGTNIDPSCGDDPDVRGAAIVQVPEFYGVEHADIPADLMVCRHTLEHVPDPGDLLRKMRIAAECTGAPVYIEVPNGDYVFDETAFAEIIYPHYSYFTKASLTALVERAGFEVVKLCEYFDNQFLGAWLTLRRPSSLPARPEPVAIESIVAKGHAFDEKIRSLRTRVGELSARGSKIAAWGAGAKAVSFLNIIDELEDVSYVVDVNPRKVAHYVPVTAQPIVAPEHLCEFGADTVFVMNPIYEAEIAADIRSRGLSSEIVVI